MLQIRATNIIVNLDLSRGSLKKVINMTNVNSISKGKWSYCKSAYKIDVGGLYERLGTNKGKFWARLENGTAFSDDEIKLIEEFTGVDRSKFLSAEPISQVQNTLDSVIAENESLKEVNESLREYNKILKETIQALQEQICVYKATQSEYKGERRASNG